MLYINLYALFTYIYMMHTYIKCMWMYMGEYIFRHIYSADTLKKTVQFSIRHEFYQSIY